MQYLVCLGLWSFLGIPALGKDYLYYQTHTYGVNPEKYSQQGCKIPRTHRGRTTGSVYSSRVNRMSHCIIW